MNTSPTKCERCGECHQADNVLYCIAQIGFAKDRADKETKAERNKAWAAKYIAHEKLPITKTETYAQMYGKQASKINATKDGCVRAMIQYILKKVAKAAKRGEHHVTIPLYRELLDSDEAVMAVLQLPPYGFEVTESSRESPDSDDCFHDTLEISF